jgi:hypothetical protein
VHARISQNSTGPKSPFLGYAFTSRSPKDLLAHYVAELTGLRAEGEYVLGLTRPIGELPADVFAPGPPDQP